MNTLNQKKIMRTRTKPMNMDINVMESGDTFISMLGTNDTLEVLETEFFYYDEGRRHPLFWVLKNMRLKQVAIPKCIAIEALETIKNHKDNVIMELRCGNTLDTDKIKSDTGQKAPDNSEILLQKTFEESTIEEDYEKQTVYNLLIRKANVYDLMRVRADSID